MEYATSWWVIAGTLVLLELITGSFYLLMLALGALVGVLCAYLGVAPSLQIVCAAVCACAFVFGCYLVRRRRRIRAGLTSSRGNRDMHLDIGATVQVQQWQNDGTARVHYRGAQWTVAARSREHEQAAQALSPGLYRVVEVVGSRLLVEPQQIEPQQAATAG